jgi:predicted RNase H-like nuclease
VPQLALSVSWTRRRRALRLAFGLLVLDKPRIELHDRDDAIALAVDAAALRVAPVARAMIVLAPPGGDPIYVTGLTGQERRDQLARKLIERYGAIGLPARRPADRRHILEVWQPSTLQLLQDCGAALDPALAEVRARPPGPGGLRRSRAKPEGDE